jgi:hypothetical protein
MKERVYSTADVGKEHEPGPLMVQDVKQCLKTLTCQENESTGHPSSETTVMDYQLHNKHQ